MSDTPPYDLSSIFQASQVQNFLFVGRDAAELLADCFLKRSDEIVKVDVVMFPYSVNENGEPVIAAGPRRGIFTGKILSVLLNERATKGRFVFSDGTVINRDNAILE